MSLEEDLGAFGIEWEIEQQERLYGEPPASSLADQHSQWHWLNGWANGCPLDCAAADSYWDDWSDEVDEGDLVSVVAGEDPRLDPDADYGEPPF